MAEFDTLIKGGVIVDGSRAPRYRADVAIKNGTIAKIGNLKNVSATRVLDAHGLIVAPGAIDLHTHYDAQIHWDPYCSIDSWHGVTSVTLGNCGFGFAPVRPEDAERAMLAMTRNEAIPLAPMQLTMPFDWETFPQWMDHLDGLPLGINLAQMVPVTPLVTYVMGGWTEAKSRQPSERELAEIIQLLHEAMDVGAMGWSAQRLVPESVASFQRDYDGTPMVSDTLSDEFYLSLATALGERDEGCIQYTQVSAGLQDPARGAQEDLAFNTRLAEESGRPLLFNAIVVNDEFPEMFRSQLKWLEEVNAKGVRIFGQASSVRAGITFTFEDWNLFDQSQVWREATLGTVEEKKAKLSDPETRRAMKEEYDTAEFAKSRPFLPFEIEIKTYIATKMYHRELKKYEGFSVAQIAAAEHKHVIDALLDLSVADDLRTEWCTPILNNKPEYAREVMTSIYTMAGVSDGGAHMKFLTAGIWPTDLLTWMVRETGILTLEDAHHRLSGMQAWAAGFKDRGLVREGLAADLMIYDLNALSIGPVEIREDLPAEEWRRVQRAEGYRWIMVNGQVIFEDGKCTGETPGRLLRFGQA
jgi:N-acyl-D-aspartate/D-glutamate deacylase